MVTLRYSREVGVPGGDGVERKEVATAEGGNEARRFVVPGIVSVGQHALDNGKRKGIKCIS